MSRCFSYYKITVQWARVLVSSSIRNCPPLYCFFSFKANRWPSLTCLFQLFYELSLRIHQSTDFGLYYSVMKIYILIDGRNKIYWNKWQHFIGANCTFWICLLRTQLWRYFLLIANPRFWVSWILPHSWTLKEEGFWFDVCRHWKQNMAQRSMFFFFLKLDVQEQNRWTSFDLRKWKNG